VTRLIGISALQIGLALALFGVGLLVAGARRDRADLVRAGYSAVYTLFALVAIATGAMVFALLTHDFSISYVAQVGSRSTPVVFTVISLWGALEGSILFWGCLLALFSAIAVYMHRHDTGRSMPYSAATLLGIAVFFLVLLVGPANPFHPVFPVPADGPGPNPLLQNHILMAVHPPLLYIGYVGFSVPFAFAIGALLSGELSDDGWIRSARLWTIVAWAFLSAAIIAGMWWSYEVLGWGGYWAWDPVENASFMPWLTATAFLHSIMVQERRGMLKAWNVNLIVVTFVLTVLGTFLTRSGILSSVHAFTQGTIGYYFLAFIAIVLISSVALVAGKASALSSKGRLDAVASRETTFLLNNLLLSVLTFTVLLGTLFPLVAEAVRGIKVSVGAPFFNRMALPVMMALLFLLGVGPLLPWHRTTRAELVRRLRIPGSALLVTLVIGLAAGVHDVYALLAFAFGAFALTTVIREFWRGAESRMRTRGERVDVALARLVATNGHRYGGYVAHAGVVMAVVGIAASSAFKTEREVTLTPGQTVTVSGVTARLDTVWGRQETQRVTVGASVSLLRGSRVIGHLEPTQHFYQSSEEPVPTPAVRSSAARDVYVNLMAFKEDGSSATLRVLVEPLVVWIWLGGLVVCIGAAIALWPRRRRVADAVVAQATPVTIGSHGERKRKRSKKRRPVPAGAGASTAASTRALGGEVSS
jgi:cytochrome c-type biogenesis protein CcmF